MEQSTPPSPATSFATNTNGNANPAAQAPTTVQKFLRYAEYVHVGPGADACPEGEKGTCQDPFHFHAYCRMPNQFQHAQIREFGLAAKARRMRQLHDSESDSNQILEAEMENLTRAGDKAAIVSELMGKNWWETYSEAAKDTQEKEQFEHIDRDFERYEELQGLPEDKRPEEEFKELERQIAAYNEAVNQRMEEVVGPEREAQTARPIEDLVSQLREERIEGEGNNAFINVYSLRQMFVGTLRPVETGTPRERVFMNVDELTDAPPEVVDALYTCFRELEASVRGERGNS